MCASNLVAVCVSINGNGSYAGHYACKKEVFKKDAVFTVYVLKAAGFLTPIFEAVDPLCNEEQACNQQEDQSIPKVKKDFKLIEFNTDRSDVIISIERKYSEKFSITEVDVISELECYLN